MAPKLFRVILPVSDISRAAVFYERALGIRGRQVSPGRYYFDCDGTILACFAPRAEEGYAATPNPEHIYFAVDDLEETYHSVLQAGAELEEGGDDVHGPFGKIHERPWGERSFYVRDPFGNRICFVDRRTVFTGL